MELGLEHDAGVQTLQLGTPRYRRSRFSLSARPRLRGDSRLLALEASERDLHGSLMRRRGACPGRGADPIRGSHAWLRGHSARPEAVRLTGVGLSAGGTNSTVMVGETRIERRVHRWIDRADDAPAAAVVIATVTGVMTVVTGLLMTVIDHDSFPSLGGGLWWAIQTVTTVGYGDHVPESAGGQILAALVMLLGIGFITVVTAAITSIFVARSGRQAQARSGDPLAEQLGRIDERLEQIEAALRERR